MWYRSGSRHISRFNRWLYALVGWIAFLATTLGEQILGLFALCGAAPLCQPRPMIGQGQACVALTLGLLRCLLPGLPDRFNPPLRCQRAILDQPLAAQPGQDDAGHPAARVALADICPGLVAASAAR